MSHDQPYQVECSICRSVAALEAKADPLQTFIRRVLPRSYSQRAHAGLLNRRQLGAIDWSLAISNCLRRAMALHPRCHGCTILMGPGHFEARLEWACSTHSDMTRAG
jgi:hypothetical protein